MQRFGRTRSRYFIGVPGGNVHVFGKGVARACELTPTNAVQHFYPVAVATVWEQMIRSQRSKTQCDIDNS